MTFTVVIAPDSFKGSISALEVTKAIESGWKSIRPNDEIICAPQADGGEGTLDVIQALVTGSIRHSIGAVSGPDGSPTVGEWLELPGKIAVVELAQCSGLPLMHKLDPEGATSRGLGEVIRSALLFGANSLIIGIGGSASTDGGAGALCALGLKLLNSKGLPISEGGAALADIASIDPMNLIPAPVGGVTLLADVAAPLLGPSGAAAIFGPQKGASPTQVKNLDNALKHFSNLLGGNPKAPGSGAAGGTAYGFTTLWGAQLESGYDYISRLSGFEDHLKRADLLLTGEGRFDQQSLGGKVVGQLLNSTKKYGISTGVIAGQLRERSGGWQISLAELAGSVDSAIDDPEKWLRVAGVRAAREFSPAK